MSILILTFTDKDIKFTMIGLYEVCQWSNTGWICNIKLMKRTLDSPYYNLLTKIKD
jgi:hypothetical protein